MLSVRRMEIKPFAETSAVNVRLMHKSGKIFHGLEYWYIECIGFRVPTLEVDAAAVKPPPPIPLPLPNIPPLRRCACGERAEMLLQILLSNGIFNKNVPYDWSAEVEAESPLSVGTNGVASPFNFDSVFFKGLEKKLSELNLNEKKIFFCRIKFKLVKRIWNKFKNNKLSGKAYRRCIFGCWCWLVVNFALALVIVVDSFYRIHFQ